MLEGDREFPSSIDPCDLRRESYAFICITTGKNLNSFSMQSLFLKLKIHKSVEPIITQPVWCHREDIYFDTAIMFQLKQLQFPPEELDISFELHARHLVTSQHLGTCRCPLIESHLAEDFRKPLYYFYKQAHLPLVDTRTGERLAKFVITIAFGYEEHLDYVEPSIKFNSVLLKYKGDHHEVPFPYAFKTVSDIEENWKLFAMAEGWSPPAKLQLVDFSKNSVTIDPEEEEESNENNLTNNLDISANTVIFRSTDTPKILSPCITPVKEINKILDQDISHEKRIDTFIQRKIIQMSTPKTEPRKFINARARSLTISPIDKIRCFSTPAPADYVGSPIRRSPSIDRIINGEDNIMDLHFSNSSDDDDADIFITPKKNQKLKRN
ncbi:hypothetical protein TVAG_495980 [Trichomonas vaginalis G3]|uniref:Uncharacterized protein n=1 Tax=Trichomonas vaginalis (strain ATCC PRA-98 / G3) TaxID=412133 RepID=A2DVN7_TRIV3|nr:hypothetical protein TVAGG3_0276120 [Trichomonas vaginalis G3]EAY15579.1 hypothetical protein TVAG_495980 [Trichomonas vaginalis G3]KAI5526225.1 hypothetical protein TVAGG3_0276120 [Trichomonas vaginalis G3]|eukprot:XP_001327802.1 hypothetical protein [Trichomonas vaginalis G3]